MHILLAQKMLAFILALLIIAVVTRGESYKAGAELGKAYATAYPEMERALVGVERSDQTVGEVDRIFGNLLFGKNEAGPTIAKLEREAIASRRLGQSAENARLRQSEILDQWGQPFPTSEPIPKRPFEINNGKFTVEYRGDNFAIRQDISIPWLIATGVTVEEVVRQDLRKAKSSQPQPEARPEEHQHSRHARETSVATLRPSGGLDLSALSGLAPLADARRAATGAVPRPAN
ncbi:MAG: hypothetical protein WA655_23220 [Candidatus Korobacteraceae bacterium]